MIAYGGKEFITPDGKLHTDDPRVRKAGVKGLASAALPPILTTNRNIPGSRLRGNARALASIPTRRNR
jgi:hypothetical protein